MTYLRNKPEQQFNVTNSKLTHEERVTQAWLPRLKALAERKQFLKKADLTYLEFCAQRYQETGILPGSTGPWIDRTIAYLEKEGHWRSKEPIDAEYIEVSNE